MNPDPPPLDLMLDVYLDGRLVHPVRLDPGAFADAGTTGAGPSRAGDGYASVPLPVVRVPADGRVRLAVDLRRAPRRASARSIR